MIDTLFVITNIFSEKWRVLILAKIIKSFLATGIGRGAGWATIPSKFCYCVAKGEKFHEFMALNCRLCGLLNYVLNRIVIQDKIFKVKKFVFIQKSMNAWKVSSLACNEVFLTLLHFKLVQPHAYEHYVIFNVPTIS